MIEKRTHLYEVLLRFDEHGFKGAHVRDLETVVETETGAAIAVREGEARAVTLAECGPLIGEANAGFIADFEAAVALRTEELALRAALAAVPATMPPEAATPE